MNWESLLNAVIIFMLDYGFWVGIYLYTWGIAGLLYGTVHNNDTIYNLGNDLWTIGLWFLASWALVTVALAALSRGH